MRRLTAARPANNAATDDSTAVDRCISTTLPRVVTSSSGHSQPYAQHPKFGTHLSDASSALTIEKRQQLKLHAPVPGYTAGNGLHLRK